MSKMTAFHLQRCLTMLVSIQGESITAVQSHR